MSAHLPEHVERLWQTYEQAERRSHRPALLETLRVFVAAFAPLPAEDRRDWVRSFCRRAFAGVAGHGGYPISAIRQPMFEGVLLPALSDLFRSGDPEAALWLSWLTNTNLARDPEATARTLGLPSFSRFAILRESLRVNPAHDRVRSELMSEAAYWFDFSLHELPVGVLYGIGGATPEQCDELLTEVDEYRRLAPESDPVRAEETAWWEFHFRAYRDYLRDARGATNYADYLERFAGPSPPPRFETGRRYPYGN